MNVHEHDNESNISAAAIDRITESVNTAVGAIKTVDKRGKFIGLTIIHTIIDMSVHRREDQILNSDEALFAEKLLVQRGIKPKQRTLGLI